MAYESWCRLGTQVLGPIWYSSCCLLCLTGGQRKLLKIEEERAFSMWWRRKNELNVEKFQLRLWKWTLSQTYFVFWPLEKNCSDILKKNGRGGELWWWDQEWGSPALVQPVELLATGREEANHHAHAGGGLPWGDAKKYSEYFLRLKYFLTSTDGGFNSAPPKVWIPWDASTYCCLV